jgi:hypothetical protein
MDGKDVGDIRDYDYPEEGYDSPKDDIDTTPKHNRKLFTASIFFSVLLLIFVMYLAIVGNVGSVGIAGVGGLYLQAEEVVGNNIQAYPTPTETAACYSNSSSSIVGKQSEVAAGALKVDVSQLRVPADKQLTLVKDIKTPSISDVGTFRIKVQRTGLATNPTYPSSASLPAAIGTVPGSYVAGTSFAGINSGTQINDGYADLTFKRTRNVLPNQNINLTVSANAEYDYSDATSRIYPFTQGVNQNRYISDVSMQGGAISNPSGDDGGYGVYTNLGYSPGSPTNISAGGSPIIDVTAETEAADYTSADANIYGEPVGEANPNFQIDDVIIDAISNTGTGGDFGYEDFTSQSTSRLSRGTSEQITVEGVKRSASFGYNEARDPQQNGNYYNSDPPGDSDFNACAGPGCMSIEDVEFAGINRNSGDDNGYYPDNPPPQGTTDVIEPGSSVPITVQAQVADGSGFFEPDDKPSVALVKVFIDWDQDGTMQSDESYVLGTGSVQDGTKSFTVGTDILVPKDAKTGSTIMRVINAVSRDDGNVPAFDYPATTQTDENPGEIDNMEVEDYYVNVNVRNTVVAWADWNKDGVLSNEEKVQVGTSVDGTGSYSYTGSITPPETALSGSHILRIQQYNGRDSANPSGNFDGYKGTTEDYTIKLKAQENSAVHAFVDWNQDGDFQDSLEIQRIDLSTLSSGSPTYSGALNVPSDAKSGSTLMRLVFQQDGYTGSYPGPYSQLPEPESFQGEVEDYTVHVERGSSFVSAWIDWDRDGSITDQSRIDVGQASAPNNQDGFTVSTDVSVPSFSGSGAAALRVKHEQAQRKIDLTPPDEGGFRGENEDYTVLLSQSSGDRSNTGNLSLGDSALVLTNLTTQNLGLTTTLIDEDYADNTPQNPIFGPDGTFTFSGDKLTLTDARGVLHQAQFGVFEINGVSVTVDYNPNNPRVKSNDACPILSYQP